MIDRSAVGYRVVYHSSPNSEHREYIARVLNINIFLFSRDTRVYDDGHQIETAPMLSESLLH